MCRLLIVLFALAALVAAPVLVSAAPVAGTYYSAFRGGAVLNGHASVSRQFPNSGNPKVFNGQSWNGSALGTQWEIQCGVENTLTPPDSSHFNKLTGTGFIVYTQTFQGGTFSIYTDPAVGWGFGSGTLSGTVATTQVWLMNFVPYASSFTAFTSGQFDDSKCILEFAMSNGFGVGETPYLFKPSTYPAFLAPDCSPADPSHQWGTWADVNDIIAKINCTVPAQRSSWGEVKSIYK